MFEIATLMVTTMLVLMAIAVLPWSNRAIDEAARSWRALVRFFRGGK